MDVLEWGGGYMDDMAFPCLSSYGRGGEGRMNDMALTSSRQRRNREGGGGRHGFTVFSRSDSTEMFVTFYSHTSVEGEYLQPLIDD